MSAYLRQMSKDIESKELFYGCDGYESQDSDSNQRLKYLETLLLWLYFSELCFISHSTKPTPHQSNNNSTAALLAVKYAVKMTVMLPDHKFAISLFEI